MKHCLPLWLLVLLWLHWPGAAQATAGPPTPGRSLAEALNPDGTLRAGVAGSFDARAFRMRTAPDGRPVFRPAGALGAGDERWADGFGLPNGTNGTVFTAVRAGNDLYIGGTFSIAGGVVVNNVAKWNGAAWSPLGAGLGTGGFSYVYALAVAGNGDVYAGGRFTQAGGAAASNVAKWNGTAWSPLGAGLSSTGGYNSNVAALAVAGNGDVYVGGNFTQAGGAAANNVAKWNGAAWSPLGAGLGDGRYDGEVYALAVAGNGDVYAGGSFTKAGGAAASRVAKWNGAAWSPLGAGLGGNGVNGYVVYALAVAGNGDVYAGGFFTQAGGAAANNVAKWNGAAWSPLGTGLDNGGSGYVVFALAVAGNGDMYAGGSFTQAGGAAASRVAKWNGAAWSPLGAGSTDGVNGTVYALAVAGNGDVYVGGDFTLAGGAAASRVAKWHGAAWSPLGAGLGVNGEVHALVVAGNGDVYAGGRFTQAGGAAAHYVAKWNGTAWSALGAGLDNGGYNGFVAALAVAGNGDVYAGGLFTQAGGAAAYNVAKWNGTAWSALGAGSANGVNGGEVHALAVAGNGDVYVGGNFTRAGGAAASSVAKWNGTAWSVLGAGSTNGVNGIVLALAMAGNGDMYAGGSFTQAGGAAASRVAKWNGAAWSPLGAGLGSGNFDFVAVLAVAGNGDVYAGGNFTQTGGAAASRVARWNGAAWSPLGAGSTNGVNGEVRALAVAGNGDVYAGGGFELAGGAAASNVAKWNGTSWNGLGTGAYGGVDALALAPTGKVYAGGGFTSTGDGSKVMAHFGIYDPAAPLAAAAAAQATPAAQLFPNPAHGTATLRLPAGTARQPLLLTDALGRPVRQYPTPAGPEAVLDLRGLPAGTYLIRSGELTQRLVVE